MSYTLKLRAASRVASCEDQHAMCLLFVLRKLRASAAAG